MIRSFVYCHDLSLKSRDDVGCERTLPYHRTGSPALITVASRFSSLEEVYGRLSSWYVIYLCSATFLRAALSAPYAASCHIGLELHYWTSFCSRCDDRSKRCTPLPQRIYSEVEDKSMDLLLQLHDI